MVKVGMCTSTYMYTRTPLLYQFLQCLVFYISIFEQLVRNTGTILHKSIL